ncbi:MAG: aldo/keto reductase [Planctomycetia bacterium]|jgi:aryl-alcohol dehydrogenase-like predicted oxidoreductase
MPHGILGRTGIHTGPLGLGGLFTSALGGGLAAARRILRVAVDSGIRYIDTAPGYADSEEILGRALRDIDEPFIISTKLGGRPQPFDPRDPAALVASVETSLKLLDREVIDVLLIHEPDRPGQYPWWTGYDPVTGPVLEAIEALRRAGKVRFAGLAGTTTSELTGLIEATDLDVLLTAFNCNVLYREADDELIPAASRRGMGIIAGSIYGQGFLGRRFDAELRHRPLWMSARRRRQFLALYALLDAAGLDIVEACVRFMLAHPLLSTILVGAKSAEQLQATLAHAEKGPLSADVVARLDEIAAMLPGRPFEEPMILPLGKTYHGPGMANVGAGPAVGRLPAADPRRQPDGP